MFLSRSSRDPAEFRKRSGRMRIDNAEDRELVAHRVTQVGDIEFVGVIAPCSGRALVGATCRDACRVQMMHHLDALGARWPVRPPFNPDAHDPMPEVEINPQDKFHVDDDFDPLAATSGLLR